MKYILLGLLILGFVGCRKEEQDPYVGKMYAKLNNSFGLLRFTATAFSLGTDSLTIAGGIKEEEILRWSINFYKIPKKTGRFNFPAWEYNFPSVRATELLSDGDVVGRMYLLPEAKESNYIEITSYNPETGDIEGRFEFTAYKSYRDGQGIRIFDLQDSMSFTNGEFYTRIRP